MSKNISLHDSLKKVTASYWVLFWILLIVVISGTAYMLRASAGLVGDIWKENTTTIPTAGTRINFANYDEVVKRIEGGDTYKPSIENVYDPFSVKVGAADE